jgi:hypothetical protein
MRAVRLFVIRRLSYGSGRAQRTPAQACVLVHAEELSLHNQPVRFVPITPQTLRFPAVQTFTGVLPRDPRPQNNLLSP